MNIKNLNNWAISQEMFQWIRKNITEGSTILEFGSGTGTVELTTHYEVYSVEQNEKWCGLASKSNYIHAPIVNGWYHEDTVFNNIPLKYDLLLVDGPAGTGNREGIAKHWDKLDLSVPIIMDDTHRIRELKFAQQTAKLLDKTLEIIPGHQKSFALIL